MPHINHQGRCLFLDDLGDSLPILCFGLSQKKCQEEVLHAVGRNTATAGQVSLFKVKLGIEAFNNLNPEVVYDALAYQLSIELAFEELDHSGHIADKLI